MFGLSKTIKDPLADAKSAQRCNDALDVTRSAARLRARSGRRAQVDHAQRT